MKRIVIIVSACALAAAVGTAVVLAPRSSALSESLTVDRFDVVGNRVLTEEEIVAMAGIDRGAPLLSVDVAAVENAVQSSPRVERAHAARGLPDRIVIRLEENVPAAIVPADAAGFFEVTAERLVLPPVEMTPHVDVPLVTGVGEPPVPGEVFESADLMSALALLGAAREVSPEMWMDVSEVRYAPGSGLVIYTVADGAKIRFGTGAPETRSLARLWEVLSDLRARGVEAETIDMRFRGQVVVRPSGRSSGGRV